MMIIIFENTEKVNIANMVFLVLVSIGNKTTVNAGFGYMSVNNIAKFQKHSKLLLYVMENPSYNKLLKNLDAANFEDQ